MSDKLYFTSEKEKELKSLPRWAKAFFAARIARRAIELVNGNKVSSHFINVIQTLDDVEKAIQEGKNISSGRTAMSPAREYADNIRSGYNYKKPADYYAALAVDDAFGLMTNLASKGTQKETGEEYQLRKINFAIGCSIQASESKNMRSDLLDNLYQDLSKLLSAAKNRGIVEDNQPVPKDILALHCTIDNPKSFIVIGSSINDKLISLLASNPKKLYELSPRAFEELIAYLFDDFGYDVELTASTRDGGKDIIAICNRPSRQKYLIECKRYSETNKVGIDVVQRLHGVINGDGASNGIIATTSAFTQPALDYMSKDHVEYRLDGKDFCGVQEWLCSYEQNQRIKKMIGSDFRISDSGLVLPRNV